MKTIIYILTHKKFDFEENDLYVPLLNGSASLKEDFGYVRDDTGDNISELNRYYAELTGQYWAWKNSDAEIIGFCHYRRYFAKNISLKKIEKKDIVNTLKEFDIILPQKKHTDYTNIEEIEKAMERGDTCEKTDDYVLLRKIIKQKSPEYLKYYDELLEDNEIYYYNMFICKKEIANDYFNWVFDILEEFRKQNDFSVYEEGNTRVLGYLSERLLNVYVKKHDLKIKEKYILQSDARFPLIAIPEQRFPFVQKILSKFAKFI